MNLTQSRIVSATGQAMFGIGGSNTYQTAHYKGYCISLEWDMQDGEPVLLIWSPLGGLGAGVFGICLSSAGKYADPNGQPTPACLNEAAAALPLLGRSILSVEVHNLVDVIMHYIPTLLMMPPAPKALRLEARGRGLVEVTRLDGEGRVVGEGGV